jgi:outer membrane protein assembly factor BamB
MRPFTRRLDPELARFLASTCKAVAAVAAVFCVAVATLLVANAVQLRTLKVQDNPALTALRERYRSVQEDEELASQIRALDLLARRAYFTRQWQVRTGAYLLLAGVLLLAACLRGAAALGANLPRPGPAEEDPEREQGRGVRRGLAVTAVVLLAAALGAAGWSARMLRREAGRPETRGAESPNQQSGGAAARASGRRARARSASGPELTATAEFRANWPQFRGPGGNGVAAPQDPPVDWDGPSGRNIIWKAEVPLPGFGSPVVWGERVFLSGADPARREIYCWDAGSGRFLWRVPVGASGSSPPSVSRDTGYAASTMAVNGQAAFAVFATGELAAVDFEGRLLWTRSLGQPRLNYGYASSLALYGDTVLVQIDQEESGRLLAVEAGTGRTRWESPRRVLASWASPVVVDTGRRVEVLLNGNPLLASYDPSTGKELWQVSGRRGEIAPSPAYAEGRVFAADQLLSLIAVDVRTRAKIWEMYDDLPDVASPLAAGELVVAAASYGVVTCLEAATGGVVWRQEFEAGFYASPVLAGGRLYLLDRAGVMRILEASREARLLASPAIGEPADATPAFRDGRIFLRGLRHLFCIGGQR